MFALEAYASLRHYPYEHALQTYMMKYVLFCLTATFLLSSTGCMENAMLLKVKKDGSGDITYRLFLSESIFQAMSQPSTESQPENGKPAINSNAMLQKMIENLKGEFGTDVTLTSSKFATNKRGWQGFEAVYSFADINDIHLDDIDPIGGTSEKPDPNSTSIGGRYTFSLTHDGEEVDLRLIPIKDLVHRSPYGEDPEGPRDWKGLLGTDLTDEFFTRLEGLRIALHLIVEGNIVETNAKFPSSKHPNVVTLLDLPFDQLLADPKAREAVKNAGSQIRTVLGESNIEGVRMEEVNKEITVRFK